MREMVLNHVSLQAPNEETAVNWLGDTIVGLTELIGNGVVAPLMRTSYPLHELHCLPNFSLFDTSLALKDRGALEEFRLFASLNVKVPLLSGSNPKVINRFLGCEQIDMDTGDGDPLLYSAISNGVSVGFPSSTGWDRDVIVVRFDELLPDGAFEERWEETDNLTRSAHSPVICARHREQIRHGLLQSPKSNVIWNSREYAFPHLIFGQDVEMHLSELNPAELGTVIGKLAGLNEAASQWPSTGSEAPPWKSLVTDENHTVKTTPKLREARRFRSQKGVRELFFWHARFGSGGRIHLRFDRSLYVVEIGYIGNHLPL